MRANRNVRHSSFIPDPSSFRRRRGVLLLLVLALLALFAMIGLAFVLIAGQASRSALTIARIGLTQSAADPAPKLCNRAMLELLVGSNNPASAVGARGMIEEVYGNNPLIGTLSGNAQYVTSNGRNFQQLFSLPTAAATTDPITGRPIPSNSNDWATYLARRIGCVLTITYVPPGACVSPSTPAQAQALVGQSTRIVATVSSTTVQVVCFADGATLPPSGTTFIINGVPFSGTGFGYNLASGQLDLTYDGKTLGSGSYPAALLPNIPLSAYAAYYNSLGRVWSNSYSAYYVNPPGGANPDYTAADYQHLLLAAQTPHPAGPPGCLDTPIPSFHRPELVNYWINQPGNGGSFDALWQKHPELCRAMMMRTIGQYRGMTNASSVDHPNFTGSNLDINGNPFNPVWDGVTAGGGQWDVDNDGDGIPDSVWVDLGAPVCTIGGRLCKPLFAPLIVDLDGRLNLNAHGCLAQTSAAYYQQQGGGGQPYTADMTNESLVVPPVGRGGVFLFPSGATGAPGTTGTPRMLLPRGMGYGPGEINLLPLFGAGNYQIYQNLLSGNAGLGLAGRYGETPGSAKPGTTGTGTTGTEGILFGNKHFEFQPYQSWSGQSAFGQSWSGPFDYRHSLDVPGQFSLSSGARVTINSLAFGSPPDPQGMMTVGLDLRGQPLYGMEQGAWSSAALNTPNELNLSPGQAYGELGTMTIDNPFSLSELERVLRPYDKDASALPSRLALLTSTSGLPGDSLLAA